MCLGSCISLCVPIECVCLCIVHVHICMHICEHLHVVFGMCVGGCRNCKKQWMGPGLDLAAWKMVLALHHHHPRDSHRPHGVRVPTWT